MIIGFPSVFLGCVILFNADEKNNYWPMIPAIFFFTLFLVSGLIFISYNSKVYSKKSLIIPTSDYEVLKSKDGIIVKYGEQIIQSDNFKIYNHPETMQLVRTTTVTYGNHTDVQYELKN